MNSKLPWYQRGVRANKFIYRGFYAVVLLLGGFILLPALMLPVLLALGATSERTFELVLAALPALIGLGPIWLAVVRLRHPIKAPRRE